MAKSNTIKIKLVSTADTGCFYVTKKNTRTATEKLAFRTFDLPLLDLNASEQRNRSG